jgi:hypothetical protein
MSNLQRRVQRLEASEESGSEAMRVALEKFAGNIGIDLTRPGVRQVLKDAFRAGTIDREGMVTWEEFTQIFDRLTELARGGV